MNHGKHISKSLLKDKIIFHRSRYTTPKVRSCVRGNSKEKRRLEKLYQDLKEQVRYGKICNRLAVLFIVFSIIGIAFFYDGSKDHYAVYPNPTKSFYINDYSSVLSDEVEKYIFNESKLLYEKTRAQIVIAAVPDTGNMTLEGYSLELANRWRIGAGSGNNGVLILFTTDDIHVRLEIGRGLVNQISNEECGKILDENAVYDIHERNWNQAAVNTWNAVAKEIYQELGQEVPSQYMHPIYVDKYAAINTFADAKIPQFDNNSCWNLKLVVGSLAFIKTWAFLGVPFIVLYHIFVHSISHENRTKYSLWRYRQRRGSMFNNSGYYDSGDGYDSGGDCDSGYSSDSGGGSFGGDGVSR